MKRFGRSLIILALCLPVIAGCGQLAQAEPTAFDELAPRVPGDAEQVYFLDLKPGGDAGRHWQRIREQLEANPTGQEALNAALQPFRVEAYGLEELIAGPAVSGYWSGVDYVIIQVSDEAGVEGALHRSFEGMAWEQEDLEGKTLYYGQNTDSWQGRERLAWTLHDDLLFLTSTFSRSSAGQDALSQLKALLSLAQEDSLAALSSWKTLRPRLPEAPMGVVFLNVAEQASRNPPAPGDTSLSTALGQNTEAVALSAMPQEDGMRVEIVGAFARQAGAPPELRALLKLPAVDPTAWASLPAGTAIALISQDASVVWPVLRDLLSIKSLDQLRDTVGLDLEADLAGEDGPLTGEFALGFTPPLPQQPISQGLAAGQLLIAARDASQAQMASVQAAMEARGAVFGPGQVEGLPLQTQVGTKLTGYAISYGFDDDTLLLGSSPDVIGQGVVAGREAKGLVAEPTFRAVMAALPKDPSFVVYLNSGPLLNLMQANMTEEQYRNNQEWRMFEVFQAIGLGLRFQRDRLDGVLQFFMAE